DGANTINISTMAALVVAACDVPVAKHGNRAASSACGSADVLEGAGLALEIDPKVAARQLHEAGFCFLFAPRYHPAMRHVAPIRRELGVRTVFNILGPLTNPARATHQIVGVARPELLEPVASVLQHLGVHAGAIVHARNGIDEIAGDVPTDVVSFANGVTQRWSIDPHDYGIAVGLDALRAADVASCVAVFGTILGGGSHPGSDVVALNAALGLLVAGRVATLHDGVELARQTLCAGGALRCFERAKEIRDA
ncbi:MAG: anthranilate phosphoribosyltransferase, partial [Vulcanimicrobiaceae bacterium]